MSEQEYINVSDLKNILSAKNNLREIIPESSKIIKENEYRTVMLILNKWQDELFKIIKIKGQK